MMKLLGGAATAAALVFGAATPSAAQTQVLGTDVAACAPGAAGPAALVRVSGLKDREGRLRLQYYSDDPKTFLASGAFIRRQEVPMTPYGDMVLCITVPAPGAYAFVVLHDRDEDGKLSIWSDGVGFSNNIKLALAKPKLAPILYTVGPGVTPIHIIMNYRRGLSVRPLAQ
ncbi:DUF2141 domain-containing protein [Polymorphobacter fuscus]|uniref:DUF2141 domain-containing protein n=1 Tax=Sandarakinorhabdus fusca TaxID=1439888 RepID=A0A7C9KNE8_9SPHN|nr:DUF2141 domain-containing protein [Polymorphobacter fuscus]KAB7646443.1 DUF2141 domain-containing protein [Polymorphobacter fuscus]MQT17684.1 DUF2141 domain-containing protein [Polymorphobacter fuscus]NJC09771.1 uncharacterized protein (DUF2141 family) [Polymorphobacter fuscus]